MAQTAVMTSAVDRLVELERENEALRRRVAYLEEAFQDVTSATAEMMATARNCFLRTTLEHRQ